MAIEGGFVAGAAMVAAGAWAQLLYNDPTVSTVLAGALGGVVRWVTEREGWRDGVGSVLVGAICAEYLGPFALGVIGKSLGIELADDTGKMGAFLMGVCGLLVIRVMTDRLKLKSKTGSENE